MPVDMSQFDKNPFESFMSGGNEMSSPMPMMGATQQGRPMQPQQGGMMPGGMGQPMQPPKPEDQLQFGQNPDNSKILLGAIQALEKFISQSTDRDEIQTARGIIMLLGRLMEKDQQKFSEL